MHIAKQILKRLRKNGLISILRKNIAKNMRMYLMEKSYMNGIKSALETLRLFEES